jgi:HPt (histidine-containing phosphotransfer) domain-containing protein
MEMIALYLKQTPPLINQMKKSLLDKDWDLVYASAHKLIPSFSIVGIHKDFEDAAKKIQEYSITQKHLEEIQGLVLRIENVCSNAFGELEEVLNLMKKSK